MTNLFPTEAVAAVPAPETIVDDAVTELMLPLHENITIVDYLNTKVFNSFTLKFNKKHELIFTTTDSTIIYILHKAKIVKEEDAEKYTTNIVTLFPKRSLIKKISRDHRYSYEEEVVEFFDMLNFINIFSDPEVKQRISDGYCCYGDIPALFPRGLEVVTSTPSGTLGGIVETCQENYSMFGPYYSISLSIMMPSNKGVQKGSTSIRIGAYDGKMAIAKLPTRPISDFEKATLTERGKKFRDFTKAPTPASYVGNLTIPTWMRDYVMCADGRVIVDSVNFAQMESDFYHDMMRPFQLQNNDAYDDADDDDSASELASVTEADLWRCYTRVHAFSMRLKRWGWIDVEHLSAVNWKDDAFEKLVLDDNTKKMMIHLVKNYGNSFTDFIEGKSGGLIFLLHGSPGTGKTLSAEAVADTLHRPLYSVSVGELGVTPNQLEENLKRILDLAFQWNAVLLLDEADIFMEARDTDNIDRNAMVSIFLRLLEYYSGVMFLTTNRVKTFDKAFFSRISLAINYPDLELENRKEVWKNVLTSANVKYDDLGLNLNGLAQFEVNGRNIKTAVRIAQTMASGDNRPITQSDFVDILRMMQQFMDDVSNSE